LRTNILHILSCSIFLLLYLPQITAQEIKTKEGIRIPAERDTVAPVQDSIEIEAPVPVINITPQDSVKPQNQMPTKWFTQQKIT
jgi:hypothetical protein